MIPTFLPFQAHTAALRLAGYAASQQIAVIEAATRFATRLPALQVRAATALWRGAAPGSAARAGAAVTSQSAEAKPTAKPRRVATKAAAKPAPPTAASAAKPEGGATARLTSRPAPRKRTRAPSKPPRMPGAGD